jgi:hypothetical protein
MASNRNSLKRNPAIKFFKLLGTGTGERFTPRDANPHRWGLLITGSEKALAEFDASAIVADWRAISTHEYSALLQTIASHGLWSGQEPFEARTFEWNGPIIAITRARIKWRENLRFWSSVPAVTQSLHSSPGLRFACGIGEAPIGLQGTFSSWESAQDLRNFAYKSSPHLAVIEKTKEIQWYSEELFARFAILSESGAL